MAKCIINAKFYGVAEDGRFPDHYGYKCEIVDGNLVGEVPEELLDIEVAAGRVKPLEEPKKAQAPSPAGEHDGKTKDEIKAILDGLGIAHTANMNKAELLALIPKNGGE